LVFAVDQRAASTNLSFERLKSAKSELSNPYHFGDGELASLPISELHG
jgi:hypothetical protein